MKQLIISIFFSFCFLALGCKNDFANSKINKTKPNIIYILADDLGYGDLSSYGQKRFTTPNIDQLAKEGKLFTRHYAGSTVCAPSRSTLLTGLHTGHTPVRSNKRHDPEGQWPLPKESFTLAELLKENGYKTGVFGKWGLGYPHSEGDPLNQGFDEFYGFNCQRLAHHYYPRYLWKNNTIDSLPENFGQNKGLYAPDLIHKEAMTFLEKNKKDPFFLYYAAIVPHAELIAPEAYMSPFRGKLGKEKPFKGYDEGPLYRKGRYESQEEPHAAFAGMITHLDDRIGEIMKKVKELGIEENTIIIFSSDNGPHIEAGSDIEYFNSNGDLRGVKSDLYEGGIRVPMIVKWKNHVEENSKTDHISAFWDVMPTIADILNIKLKTPTDGLSFLPTLLNQKQPQHDYLYWEFHEKGGRVAILKNHWKLIKYDIDKTPQKSFELYNLKEDPYEQNDLAQKHPEIVDQLSTIILNAREESEVFKFKNPIKP